MYAIRSYYGRRGREERKEIRNRLRELRKMDPEERKKILDNYSAFRRLTPQERRRLQQNYDVITSYSIHYTKLYETSSQFLIDSESNLKESYNFV